MGKKLTQEEFITRCVAVHGDMYDYSFAVYTGMHEKVRIICREHGEFQQAPACLGLHQRPQEFHKPLFQFFSYP